MHSGHIFLTILLTILLILFLLFQKNHKTSIGLDFDEVQVQEKGQGKVRKTSKHHVPKFMLELYANKNGPDVVRSLIPKHASSFNELDDNHLIVFNLPEMSEDEEFVSAELKILTIVGKTDNNAIERELEISIYNDSTKTSHNLQHINFYHFNSTWLSFDLTQTVISILSKKAQHENYLKIIISLKSYIPNDSIRLSLLPQKEDFDHDYPVLILSYNDLKTRKKRNIEEDYEEETNNVWDEERMRKYQSRKYKKYRNSCRRRPLYINFSEIEYDSWIVQPPGYDAYQCQGKCFYPVAEHLNPTKHAVVQAMLHSVSPTKVTRTCCVPTLLDSISILYVDEQGVLTYRYAYKDMVVVECGCR